MLRNLAALVSAVVLIQGCAHKGAVSDGKEKHFKTLRQLTFQGTNAEAYFSPDGKRLIFQGRGGDVKCDQVYMMNVDGSGKKLISTKGGRNTCSFFIDNDRILYSSTHAAGEGCPTEHDRSKGYVWDIFKSYDIYTANAAGEDIKQLTSENGYDAETTVCGGRLTFTSARKGDSLHVYTMNLDGSDLKQLTKRVGYSGGPTFSKDCGRIVYRAHHPADKEAKEKFKKAVREAYIPQGPLEIHVMDADGKNNIQLTAMGKSSFAPAFYPQGDKIIMSSNSGSFGGGPHGHAFQLWAIDARKKAQTSGEQITSEGTFNGFPMFSPDGKWLVFASNRNSSNRHELQVFLAEWQD